MFALLVILMIVISQGSNQSNAQKRRNPHSQSSIADSGWPAYGRDPGGSRYSPLAEINRENVNNLKVAWTYRTGAADVKTPLSRKAAFEATPILIEGTLYLSTPFNRVVALDPETGREKWRYDPKVDTSVEYSEFTSRGVSTWADRNGKAGRRIFVATLDAAFESYAWVAA